MDPEKLPCLLERGIGIPDSARLDSLQRNSGLYETFAKDARHALTQGVHYVTISITFQAAAATVAIGILSVWKVNTVDMPNAARIAGGFLIGMAWLVPYLASLAVERVERRQNVARARQAILELNAFGSEDGWPKVVDAAGHHGATSSARTAICAQWLFAICSAAAWAGLCLWIGAVWDCSRAVKSLCVASASLGFLFAALTFRGYRIRSMRHRIRDLGPPTYDKCWLNGLRGPTQAVEDQGRKPPVGITRLCCRALWRMVPESVRRPVERVASPAHDYLFGNRLHFSPPACESAFLWNLFIAIAWVALVYRVVPPLDLGTSLEGQEDAKMKRPPNTEGWGSEPSRLQDMILTPLVVLLPFFAQADKPAEQPTQAEKPISINRVFTKGERCQYEVKGSQLQEVRERGLNTWIPIEEDIEYKFTTVVNDVKPDGVAEVRYKRPTMTFIAGQTANAPAKSKVQKVNLDYLLSISPINEVISIKDLSPKKKEEGEDKPKPDSDGADLFKVQGIGELINVTEFLDAFTRGLSDMLLFVGSPDSALDLAPKLPFEEVTKGYTWKKTGFFSAQKLAGEDTKMAITRVDYSYTYQGEMEVNGKKILRVHADLDVDTNLSEFFHQQYDLKPKQTGIKAIPLKMTSRLDFDLDPVNRRTLKAVAVTVAEVKKILNDSDVPHQEIKIKGTTKMKLLNAKN